MSWVLYDSEGVDLDSEEDPYWLFREALSAEYQDASPEEIEDLLLDAEIAPAVIAGIASIASSVIPVIAQAIRSGKQRPRSPSPPPGPSSQPPLQPPSPTASTPALNQLLAVLTRPELLQAVLSAIATARGAGNPTARAGRESWPVGTFFTMLETLARDAGEEFRALEAEQAIERESYLGDESIDPAVPEGRAYALADTLTAAMDEEYATAEDAIEQLVVLSEAYEGELALAEALYGTGAETFFVDDVEVWIE